MLTLVASSWCYTVNLNTARGGQTAMLLQDGKALWQICDVNTGK
jgi:hypothetical protein